MKKISLLLLMLLSIGYFLSCDTKDPNECETCKLAESSIQESTIFGTKFKFTKFATDDNYAAFMYKAEDDFSVFINFFVTVNIPIVESSIAGITLYAEHDLNFITQENIKGFLIYQTVGDGMVTRLFIKENNEFKENGFTKLKTRIISSNDIYDVSQVFFSTVKDVTPISLINYSSLPKTDIKKLDFQKQLSKKMSTVAHLKSGRDCQAPCKFYKDAFCYASERQNGPESWQCAPTKCPKLHADATLAEVDPLGETTYSISSMNNNLWSFRDNYLDNYSGGQDIVDLYYTLDVPVSNLTVSFCRETMDVINNTILPLTHSLETDPYSTNILYDNSKKTDIISYLNHAKALYDDNASKDKIDDIIGEVTYLSNKSNAFITDYLENK